MKSCNRGAGEWLFGRKGVFYRFNIDEIWTLIKRDPTSKLTIISVGTMAILQFIWTKCWELFILCGFKFIREGHGEVFGQMVCWEFITLTIGRNRAWSLWILGFHICERRRKLWGSVCGNCYSKNEFWRKALVFLRIRIFLDCLIIGFQVSLFLCNHIIFAHDESGVFFAWMEKDLYGINLRPWGAWIFRQVWFWMLRPFEENKFASNFGRGEEEGRGRNCRW